MKGDLTDGHSALANEQHACPTDSEAVSQWPAFVKPHGVTEHGCRKSLSPQTSKAKFQRESLWGIVGHSGALWTFMYLMENRGGLCTVVFNSNSNLNQCVPL